MEVRKESIHERAARFNIERAFLKQKAERKAARRDRVKKRKRGEAEAAAEDGEMPENGETIRDKPPTKKQKQPVTPVGGVTFTDPSKPAAPGNKKPGGGGGFRKQALGIIAFRKSASQASSSASARTAATATSSTAGAATAANAKGKPGSQGHTGGGDEVRVRVGKKSLPLSAAQAMANRLVQNGLDWESAHIHPSIARVLNEKGFTQPTPIQKATLRPALQFQNIIASAPTGSGKTLAFGIPIVHHILCDIAKTGRPDEAAGRLLSCLVIAPLRELAMQISEHLQQIAQYTTVKSLAMVGGINEEKQNRLLKGHPHILVSTPGRLAKLMHDSPDPFLRSSLNLQLKYLVIDEADRLLEMHHFLDLNDIMAALNTDSSSTTVSTWGTVIGELKAGEQPNPSTQMERKYTSTIEEFTDLNAFLKADNPLNKNVQNKALPQIRCAVPNPDWHPSMLTKEDLQALPSADKTTHSTRRFGTVALSDKPRKVKVDKLRNQPIHRLVFITSATMTLNVKFKDGTQKLLKWCGEKADAVYLPTLVSRLGMKLERFKMIDLNPEQKVAERIQEFRIDCSPNDKDLFLYYFINTYPGRTVVFVNSVTCVRRVTRIFELLKVPIWPVHSQMQQRQRLKNLERFKETERGILVATDVIGRGIDVPDVCYVIHYQFPRNAEQYFHRTGRTARGTDKQGLALSLVSPPEMTNYKKVCYALGYRHGLKEFPIDANVRVQLKFRIDLATELNILMSRHRRDACERKWFVENAAAIEVDLDEKMAVTRPTDSYDEHTKALKMKQMKRQLDFLLKRELTGAKGAYLSSGANLQRREMAKKARALAIDSKPKSKAEAEENEDQEEDDGGDYFDDAGMDFNSDYDKDESESSDDDM